MKQELVSTMDRDGRHLLIMRIQLPSFSFFDRAGFKSKSQLFYWVVLVYLNLFFNLEFGLLLLPQCLSLDKGDDTVNEINGIQIHNISMATKKSAKSA